MKSHEDRVLRLWQELIDSQGGRCADCGEPITLEASAKHGQSFRIVCHPCYGKPMCAYRVYDDLVSQEPS